MHIDEIFKRIIAKEMAEAIDKEARKMVFGDPEPPTSFPPKQRKCRCVLRGCEHYPNGMIC